MASRIEVRKTYKLYIGGAFPRSESAYSYEVTDSRGRFQANAALASRKDANKVYYRIADPKILQLIGAMRSAFCSTRPEK